MGAAGVLHLRGPLDECVYLEAVGECILFVLLLFASIHFPVADCLGGLHQSAAEYCAGDICAIDISFGLCLRAVQ